MVRRDWKMLGNVRRRLEMLGEFRTGCSKREVYV